MLTPDQFSMYERCLFEADGFANIGSIESTRLLQKGILLSFFQDNSPQAIDLLFQTAHASPLIEIRSTAIQLLAELAAKGQSSAIQGLFNLVIFHDQPEAIPYIRSLQLSSPDHINQTIFYLLSGQSPEFRQVDPNLSLLTNFYFNHASESLQERLTAAASRINLTDWVLFVTFLQKPDDETLSNLVTTFPQLSPGIQNTIYFWLTHFARNGSQACKDILCQFFIQNDSAQALEIMKEEKFTPSNPIQLALFFFLSNNWDAYTKVDFNHAFLAQAFELAAPPLRKRILDASRTSGHQEWLTGLSTAARTIWIGDLSDPDWQVTLTKLMKAGRDDELWRLAQSAPPRWSARLINELAKKGWQPSDGCNDESWASLKTQAEKCLSTPLSIKPAQVWRSPSSDLLCLAFDSRQTSLACGGSDGTIYIWDTQHEPRLINRLSSSAAQIRQLAFSPDGSYLVSAHGDHMLRIFRLDDGRLIKIMEGHTALVRSLVFHPDGRSLVSAGFDGTLRLWRFPQGQLLRTFTLGKTEVMGIALSSDGKTLLHAGSDQTVTSRQWPSGEPVQFLKDHSDTILSLACSPHAPVVASCGRDQKLLVWNYQSSRILSSTKLDETTLSQLQYHPSQAILLGGTMNGNFVIRSASTGASLAEIRGHSSSITGLVSNQTGEQIFTASLDGMICQWDLRYFLAVNQLQLISSSSFASYSKMAKESQVHSPERAWMEFVVALDQKRQQFDIQIDEVPVIMPVGEFDIQL